MAPWALAWLPAVTPRSPSRPSRPTKNAKRAARRHSVPPLAAPLPERNPEVLTAALSCWNWLIAATPPTATRPDLTRLFSQMAQQP
ncbi:uncharacterized protein K444DRAFT_617521 [Hyaloscypha bicolor E]|uniref:Uncharacterized protein n=1 Tax=Hyaloscypha bicolor E TaxID=1095630 RepID=A0A2J6SWC7_9HELO|nr:uncharacterized protein K444DRAFT_617521 [Hyaloscypha bicolor E]PMD55077.1 hypothetical protein K444DRAFT_617521 [Hyaloscypha bicolor E]